MNLGKLLITGKSLVTNGKPAAYRADKRVYLPKFVSPKNPFASAAAVQTELPKPSASESAEPAKKPAVMQWAKTQKMPTAATTAPSAKSTPGKTVAAWTSRLNPVTLWRGGSKNSEKDAPHPVQTELSLEKVKVVHNDLTDADVEVVPMKSRPAREPGLASQAVRPSWEDVDQPMLEVKAI